MSPTRDTLPLPVRELLAAGHKIEAIKRLRFMAGLDLKAAKDRIDAYERGETEDRPTVSGSVASFAFPPDAMRAVKRGDLVEAVKIVRESIGGSLVEAKVLVEEMQRRESRGAVPMPPPAPHTHKSSAQPQHPAMTSTLRSPGLPPGKVEHVPAAGKWVALIAIGAAIIGAALYFG